MDKQNFDTTVNSLFSGMDHVLSQRQLLENHRLLEIRLFCHLLTFPLEWEQGPLIKKREAVQAVESEVKCPQVLF